MATQTNGHRAESLSESPLVYVIVHRMRATYHATFPLSTVLSILSIFCRQAWLYHRERIPPEQNLR